MLVSRNVVSVFGLIEELGSRAIQFEYWILLMEPVCFMLYFSCKELLIVFFLPYHALITVLFFSFQPACVHLEETRQPKFCHKIASRECQLPQHQSCTPNTVTAPIKNKTPMQGAVSITTQPLPPVTPPPAPPGEERVPGPA